MKKSFKMVLAAVCLMAAGAFYMGCSSATGGGNTPPVTYIGTKAPGTALAVGDIVFNDGSATPYSKIDARTDKQCTDAEKAAAIAVIFRVGDGTEGNKTLGVGIKHNTSFLAWCYDSNVKGNNTNFTETVCEPDEGTSAGSLTFKNSPNTDGSKNLAKMIAELTKTNPDINDTGVTCNADGTINFSASPDQTTLATNYPTFEFAYYYGKNSGHNITSGSAFETGWYLPSESELNDIYQANKTGSVIENALDVIGGDKFNGLYYWSSSQYASENTNAYLFYFSGGGCFKDYKSNDYYPVCAVRAFN